MIKRLLKKQGQMLNYYRDLVDYCEYNLQYKIDPPVSITDRYIAVETLDG